MSDEMKRWGDETVIISGFVKRITPLDVGDFRGKRAELNVYDDACDIDGQRMAYLHKDDVISAELMNKINAFANSEEAQRFFEKIIEKLPDGCGNGGVLYPINLEDEI